MNGARDDWNNFPSDFKLDQFEHAAEAEFARLDASIAPVESGPFDFCTDCPLVKNIPPTERDAMQESICTVMAGGYGVYNGTTVTMEVSTKSGAVSKEMLLGRISGNAITGYATQQIINAAAERTRNCTSPKRVPAFLGPMALKRCAALQKAPPRNL